MDASRLWVGGVVVVEPCAVCYGKWMARCRLRWKTDVEQASPGVEVVVGMDMAKDIACC